MRRVSLRDISELIFLSAIWGSSFLFLRLTSPVFGPIFLIEMRVLSGLTVLLPLVLFLGKLDEFQKHWKMIATVSLMNMAIPFCFFAFSSDVATFIFKLHPTSACSLTLRSYIPIFFIDVCKLIFEGLMPIFFSLKKLAISFGETDP